MGNGRTLTGEILQRLEGSFPSLPDRVAALEARLTDPRKGLGTMLARIEELERRLAELSPPGPRE